MTERVLPEPCGVLDSSSIFAIAFRVNEGNNDCGRGLWSLTHLVLSLSRVYNDSDTVTLSVEVFQMLVSCVMICLLKPSPTLNLHVDTERLPYLPAPGIRICHIQRSGRRSDLSGLRENPFARPLD